MGTVKKMKEHVTEIKINGFASYYSGGGRYAEPMRLRGKADGKDFDVKTTGKMTIGEIIEEIERQVRQ